MEKYIVYEQSDLYGIEFQFVTFGFTYLLLGTIQCKYSRNSGDLYFWVFSSSSIEPVCNEIFHFEIS